MNSIEKFLYLFLGIVLSVMFFKFAVVLLLGIMLLGFLRTWQMQKEPNQIMFLEGSLPNPLPDGFYQGSTGFPTSWLGKKFNAEKATGSNIVNDKKTGQIEKYPFKTYTDKGLFDKHVWVLKIDYNIKGNPFWIRWILDEIVQIAPGQYLGKMQLRIIPGFPLSVLYFELKKE